MGVASTMVGVYHGHMTTTPNTERPGTRDSIDAWSERVDALLTAADAVPFVTFPRDRSAGIVRHA